MKKVSTKVISVFLSAAVAASSLTAVVTPALAVVSQVTVTPGTPYNAAGNYDVTVPHVFINQVYGGGLATDTKNTASSHGYIELYNPTDRDISLEGWSLQYADRGTPALTGATGDWQKLDLTGTIKARSSFLVLGQATGSAAPKFNLTNTYDQMWSGRFINNKGLKVALLSNQTKLDMSNKNPFANDPKPAGYVDMLGTGSNDGDNTNVLTDIDGYEVDYPKGDTEGTSKQKGVRRKTLNDTDNNKLDFAQFDITGTGTTDQDRAAKGPKYGAYGPWGELGFSTISLPVAYEQTAYSVMVNVYGGKPPYTFSATGLPAGLSINSVTGEVAGTPAQGSSVTTNVYVKVTDSLTAALGQNLSLTVQAPAIFNDTLNITKIAQYSVGVTNKDGGVAEIVKYNKDNQKFYLVNGSGNPPSLEIVRLDLVKGLVKEKTITMKQLVETGGFLYGDLTSVDVNTTSKRISVSVQELDSKKPGKILVMDYDGVVLKTYEAGIQPDMIKSTPDGRYILTANEGEPRTSGVDPEGSITIVDTLDDSVSHVRFTDTSVIDDKVHIRGASDPTTGVISGEGKKADAVFDLEPEYITLSEDNTKAYVSFQENNAIGTVDIAAKKVLSVKGLGLKDLSLPRNSLDLVKDGAIKFENVPFYGMYMPDGISSHTINGTSYLFTANEGDVTEWPGVRTNGSTIGAMKASLAANSPAAIFLQGKTTYDGVEVASDMGNDGIYMYGGRSFSIWQANTMQQVYDSGNDFEKITSQRVPNNFNTSNSKTALDDRSSKKGPEPEDVKVSKVGSKVLAFVGLERVGGIMTYDVTDPANAQFVSYTNSRVYTPKDNLNTDTGPEGIEFIPASASPNGNPLLLVANEVGGTVAVYQLNVQKIALSQSALSFTEGNAAIQLTAAVTNASGEAVAAGTVTWKSSNPAVATVSAEGKVTPVVAGTAVITALSPDGYGTAEAAITVTSSSSPSTGGNGSPAVATPAEADKPTTSGQVTTIKTTATKDTSGTSTANVSAAQVTEAMKAISQISGSGKSTVLEIKAAVDPTSQQAVIKFPAEAISKVASGSTDMKIEAGIGSVRLDSKALVAVSAAATSGEVSITIAKTDVKTITQNLTPAAKTAVEAAVSNHPVFDFTIQAGGKIVSTFNGGTASVQVPYTPASGEDINAIVAFYITDNGEITKVTNSHYDPATGTLSFKVTHFSQYAVGYNKVSFQDTAASFAKDYITYLSSRDVIKGVSEGSFAPEASITRADFALILARIAGADLSSFTGTAFTDIKVDSYYAKAVQWAAAKGITGGVREGEFAPGASITREQMATMITRFAASMKVTLQATVQATEFADKASIPAYALEAAKALQQAGIISGKSGNLFAPKETASRQEAAKMLALLLQTMVK
ncbi:choice-of-anchor I family protein [Paenibacillus sp. HWE-109]|uniref:choice-of-anchor I family protein n=1 Tax=Paenibacillus sp. HWE-109 TaxID=1306526 RepID=UPI001EDDD076|nr:choice-of-anchor I family protein [Paenibacillus sp. HWE-109]UKS26050.1 choice-of-anchor I family protein [Paenibacillus sp. HWE-109]